MVRTIAAASAARRYGNLEMIINFFCLSITATYEHRMEPNLVAWTSLLSAHARCGKCEDVLRLFCEMRLKRNGATAETVEVALSVCADFYMIYEGRGNECLDMFRRMLYANVDPNSVTFAGVLSACGELAVLDRGIKIHGHSIRACLDNNILGYGMHGFGEDGLLTFRQMVEVGQRPMKSHLWPSSLACSHALDLSMRADNYLIK
ncbi:hypothetical protein Sjap_011679 [Stephania japonica]|uniref:Pentatricopeptide repeat-containing protein n=1 Tax=Stephania japonica TaxID=461633 RepID=A0AAP0JDZ5_9MAGN